MGRQAPATAAGRAPPCAAAGVAAASAGRRGDPGSLRDRLQARRDGRRGRRPDGRAGLLRGGRGQLGGRHAQARLPTAGGARAVIGNSGSGRGGHRELVGTIVGSVVFLAVLLTVASHGGRPPAATAVPRWLLGHLGALLGRWTPLVLGLVALLALGWTALELLRWTVLIPRTLRTRVAYAVPPPPDFD